MAARYTRLMVSAALALGSLAVVATPTAVAASVPTVTSLAPHRGGNDHAAVIAISGTGFAPDSTVAFGTKAARSTAVQSSTLIYARPPALSGTVDVRVTTDGQQSPVTADDRYTIATPPENPSYRYSLGFHAINLSCGTDGYCLFVGYGGKAVAFTGDVRGPLQSIPAGVYDVVCTSASFCAGRGAGDHAYVFDGSGWSASAQLPTLTPGETDIACSVSSCLVASTNGTWWRYHGTAWTSGTDGPRPPPGYRGSIDVSCGTATFCVAGLGLTDDEEDKYSELYQFDGASWSTPTRYNNYPDRGTTVSCSSATYCFAETMGGDREWNGTRWTTVTTSPEWHLDSVRCFAADACLGEGRPHLSDVNDYVMRFDGTRWTAAAVIPNNVATPNALPPALDCWSMTTCRSLTSIDYTRLWRASSGFGPAREIWNRLYAGVDVSCAAGPFCVAASPRGNMGVWDGGAWRAAVRIDRAAAPTAVSCTAAGTCVVVDDGGYAITTTREGDVVSSRRIDTRALSDISCASPDFCVATDSAGRVVRFEGGSWHTPTQHSPDGRLHTVSCPSAAFCMAVGHGYAVRYQGHGRWTRAEKIATYTHTVTCTSASFCMVGTRNLIRIWGGAAFSPAFSIGFSQITTISCPAETYCLVASDDATYQGFTDYKALDSTASSLPAYLVYSHAMSCWAPRQCFLFGDGDRGEITQ